MLNKIACRRSNAILACVAAGVFATAGLLAGCGGSSSQPSSRNDQPGTTRTDVPATANSPVVAEASPVSASDPSATDSPPPAEADRSSIDESFVPTRPEPQFGPPATLPSLPSPDQTLGESTPLPTTTPPTIVARAEEEAAANGSPVEHEVNAGQPDVPAADSGAKSDIPLESQNLKPPAEALFEGWGDPAAALLVTGRQHGYIEPCGCTGLTNQKGGLIRRFTLQKRLVDRGWEVVGLDVGNQVRRFGRQAEIKLQMTIEGLRQMNYRAIAFGPDDLRLSTGELLALTADDGNGGSPFVCANAAVIDPSLTPAFHVLAVGDKKIGVTAVLGDSLQAKIASNEIVRKPAADGLREVWPKLEAENCDLYVLLAHATTEETQALVRQFPHFDIVVTAGGAGEPAFQPQQLEGTKSIIVQVGTKGMYAGVIGWFPAAEQRLRYQRVPLDARFEDAPEMLDLMATYQQQLKAAGLEGLGVRPVPHPSGRQFVGSQACADCHDREFEIWENTPHSYALESLIHPGERVEIPRHFDPECLSCHVTGWNPQQYFPYTSGYLSVEKTPRMFGSGCENCHGPGSAHVAAESGEVDDATDELYERLRSEMRLKLSDAEKKCLECHDLDNSPDFHVPGAFEKYWEHIAH